MQNKIKYNNKIPSSPATTGPRGSNRTRCSAAACAAVNKSAKNRCLLSANSSRPIGVTGGSSKPPNSL